MGPALADDLSLSGAEPQGEWFTEGFGVDNVKMDDSVAKRVKESRDGNALRLWSMTIKTPPGLSSGAK